MRLGNRVVETEIRTYSYLRFGDYEMLWCGQSYERKAIIYDITRQGIFCQTVSQSPQFGEYGDYVNMENK